MRHGSQIDPPNRFQQVHTEWEDPNADGIAGRRIEYIDDDTKTIVAQNDSPDLPFRYSMNPYRGCIHGCSYCYARPTHEYLGFSAGLDFETKIVVKRAAPVLFRRFLSRKSWRSEPIAMSGVTDCYQPAERRFQLTRQCLQVALDAGQSIGIVTKNSLVVRDLDLLRQLADRNLVHVYLSVTTLDPKLARNMEPRTTIPAARLRAIESLADGGIPVGVMLAPIIPGLNDTEIPTILRSAQAAGARAAGYTLLRLPLTVATVFVEWLQRTEPNRAEKIIGRVRQTRGGKINSSQFAERMTGSGEIAQQIRALMHLFRQQYSLDRPLPDYDLSQFRRPTAGSDQQWLF